MSLFLAAGAC